MKAKKAQSILPYPWASHRRAELRSQVVSDSGEGISRKQ